jgi:two-component system response regulator
VNVDAHAVEILLVEDSPEDARLTLRAFRRSQLSSLIHLVHDGAEAIEFLFGGATARNAVAHPLPELILLDLKLPRTDGLEVLRRVKADPRTRSVPVVVLTSSGEASDLAQAYELGANSYIVKPVDFDQFVETVRQVGSYWLLLNRLCQAAGD